MPHAQGRHPPRTTHTAGAAQHCFHIGAIRKPYEFPSFDAAKYASAEATAPSTKPGQGNYAGNHPRSILAEDMLQNPGAFLEQFGADSAGRVFAEPYLTPDGVTVIPVAKVRGAHGATTAKPLGVFVVRDEQTSWVPAVDADRIALIGVLTGLLAAVIGTLAVLRRPPWPDLSDRHPVSPHPGR